MKKNTIVYLSYTGLCEPLGQSQVLNYMKKIAINNKVEIVSFEKECDFDTSLFNEVRRDCQQSGVIWHPRRYHKKPRLLATVFDVAMMINATKKVIRRSNNPDGIIIHCRSYVAGLAGLILHKLFGYKFIFDMRALWIDEIIEGKTVTKNSLLAKMLYKLEGYLLASASHVVSLTESAIPYLKSKHGVDESKFTVIPTCVDIDKFTRTDIAQKEVITVGTMGTVLSGRVNSEMIFKLCNAFADYDCNVKAKIITKDSKEELSKVPGFSSSIEVTSATSETIVSELTSLDFCFVFFTEGVSTLGTSPTRIGEVLSLGIPIIANGSVGDVESIVKKYNVGVIVDNGTDSEIDKVIQCAIELKKDPYLSSRCRQAAIEYYSLSIGVNKLENVYCNSVI